MNSYYIYSILVFITILAMIQVYYIKKKFSQQNIRIIDDYLHSKFTIKILSTIMENNVNRYETIQNLIISYFQVQAVNLLQVQAVNLLQVQAVNLLQVQAVNLLQVDKGKLEHEGTVFWSRDIELNNIQPNSLIKLEADNQWGMYFVEKKIFLLLLTDEQTPISKSEGRFLEEIVLPLYAMSSIHYDKAQ